MNMHGVILPAAADLTGHRGPYAGVRAWLSRNRLLLLIVGLPTLVAALYFALVATPQYESEAHFLVRSASSTPAAGSGIGAALSLAGGLTGAQSESMSVADYLTSLDAVMALQRSIGLIERFQRPGTDYLSVLHADDANPQDLLTYYRKRVHVEYHSDTGITTLAVRSFTPKDSYAISQRLLVLGEQRVNALNERGFQDAVSDAQRRLLDAEGELGKAQAAVAQFRSSRREIDPAGSGEAQLGLVTALKERLVSARAQLGGMRGLISTESPQFVAQAAHVRALEAQLAAQSSQLSGGGQSIASSVGPYEDLRLKQEFATKRYEAALASVEKAREQAQKQQLYVVRIVNPNIPQKAQYPKGLKVVLTIFFGLLITYSIGWLIAAGVREHTM